VGRNRSPNREKAMQMWLDSNGKLANKQIAEALGENEKVVAVWKQRDKWNVVQQKNQCCATNKQNVPAPNTRSKNEKKEADKEPELTEKQVLFVAEYLTDFNATRAAMAAGYSKKTAKQIGYENLTKPYIQEEVKRQTELVTSSLGITSQRVLLEYLKIAFADISEYVTFGQREVQVMGAFGPIYEGKGKNKKPVMKTVNFVDFKSSAIIDSTLISEVRQGKDGVSIKFHDKMKALEKVEKYLDLLPDHHKRMIEEEKLKLAREQHELNKLKVTGEDDEIKDDGFMEALKGQTVKEAWAGETDV